MVVSIDQFKQLDMRIAQILEVFEHPNAGKLYILKISLGDETRQIIAGVKDQYTPEELKGRKIVVISNLEPAKIRGEESQGMLLAANDEGRAVIIAPDAEVPIGTSVT